MSLELSEGGVGWMGFVAGPHAWVESGGSPLGIPSVLGTIPVSALGHYHGNGALSLPDLL